MCLVALAVGRHERFPFVIAANRDESHVRPTEPLSWWVPEPGAPAILGGRDLAGGGTWMGLTANGRMAMLTNIRAPGTNDPDAPSRGRIVTDWLATQDSAERFCRHIGARGHNGFNPIAADAATGERFWASSASATPERLGTGLYGLSNAALDTPWPKVLTLKTRMADALAESTSVEVLADKLFAALADRTAATDALLPATGLVPEAERLLSSAFVEVPERGYGTRCSTVFATERIDGHDVTHVFERTFDSSESRDFRQRHTVVENWPPRPLAERSPAAAYHGSVVENDLR